MLRRYFVAMPVLAAGVAVPIILLLGAHGQLLPEAQPEYAASFQGLLDMARPHGANRIVVKDCRRGRVGNEHFCAWVDDHGVCRAGFILEDPGSGTVPEKVGRVGVSASECSTAHALHELGDQ